MVTIEQKLSLFSKLLQQDVKNDTIEKLELLDKEYEEKLVEHKALVDAESEVFIEEALKKAKIKRIETISKAKMDSKKHTMAAKEQKIDVFINKLKEKCREFVQTKDYEEYLKVQINRCKALKDDEDEYLVGMTHIDCDKYGNQVIEGLVEMGIRKERLVLTEKDDSIIGGFVLEVPKKNIRIDLSISAMLEEHKDTIVEKIFAAMEEDGEDLE